MRLFYTESFIWKGDKLEFKPEDIVEEKFWGVLQELIGIPRSIEDFADRLQVFLRDNICYPTSRSTVVQKKILKAMGEHHFFFKHFDIFIKYAKDCVDVSYCKDLEDFVFSYTHIFKFKLGSSCIIEYVDRKINDFEYYRGVSDESAKRLLIVFFFEFVGSVLQTSNLFKFAD